MHGPAAGPRCAPPRVLVAWPGHCCWVGLITAQKTLGLAEMDILPISNPRTEEDSSRIGGAMNRQ